MTGAFACCLVKQFDADCGAQWRAFYSLLSPSYSNPVASGPGDPDKEKAEAYTQLESALSVSDGVTHVNLGAIQGWMLKYTQKQAQVFQIRPGESHNNNGFAITFTSNAEEWHAMEAAPSPFAGATALSWIIRPWGSR